MITLIMTMIIIIIRAFLNMGDMLVSILLWVYYLYMWTKHLHTFLLSKTLKTQACWYVERGLFLFERAWHDNHVKIVWNSGFSSKHQAWWLQEHFSIFNRKIFEVTDRLVSIFWWWSCSNMFSKPRSHDVFPFFVLSHVNDTCNFPSK